MRCSGGFDAEEERWKSLRTVSQRFLRWQPVIVAEDGELLLDAPLILIARVF